MSIFSKITDKIRDWLKIEPATTTSAYVVEESDHATDVFVNKIWYRGNAKELSQLYQQLDIGEQSFWASKCAPGQEMRKIHSGVPRLLIDTLTNISIDDLNDFIFEDETAKELWEGVAKENNFRNVLKSATRETLALGDGAFKISFDPETSNLPIISFYDAEHVDFEYESGRISEVIFYTTHKTKDSSGKKEYTLAERYGRGYVKYKLFDEFGTEVPMYMAGDLDYLRDVEFSQPVMLAVPYIIFNSEKYKGRGQSIFDGKQDMFDALDEVYSQWIDSMRAGKVKTYIPESMIPRDPMTGEAVSRYNPFDTRFISTHYAATDGAPAKIEQVGGNVQVDLYSQTYEAIIESCFQGIASTATFGIGIRKIDNGTAQREKEKMTLYTRAAIIMAATQVIQTLVEKTFYMIQIQNGQQVESPEFTFGFGEYANPSFESLITALSTPNIPMSVEARVEELWGDSKTKEWKDEEVERIKKEQGIVELPEPTF